MSRCITTVVSNQSPFLIKALKDAIHDNAASASQPVSSEIPGEGNPYVKLGKPVVGMIASGTFYHSTADVADTIPPAGSTLQVSRVTS